MSLPIFDHVAIAVRSIPESAAVLELLTGDSCSTVQEVESQDVRVAFVGKVELLEPCSPESTVAKFLDRRGEGLHHIAFRVPDLEAEMARLSARGLHFVDDQPRQGAHGMIAFLHPRSTGRVLIELVQRDATSP